MNAGWDLHIHTPYCDGKSPARDSVEQALKLGLETVVFSGHAHTPFDERYCMSVENTALYVDEIRALQTEYRGRIDVLLGVEQDLYADAPTADYDYVIGSVHYLKRGDSHIPVDEGTAYLRKAADMWFGGDPLSVAEAYFAAVAELADRVKPDIVGHFDLITKYQEREPFLDPSHPRYVRAWQKAADRLLDAGAVFEINTGAIARGLKSAPYPAADILRYLRDGGGRFVFSSDSHKADTVAYGFSDCRALADAMGLRFGEDLPKR